MQHLRIILGLLACTIAFSANAVIPTHFTVSETWKPNGDGSAGTGTFRMVYDQAYDNKRVVLNKDKSVQFDYRDIARAYTREQWHLMSRFFTRKSGVENYDAVIKGTLKLPAPIIWGFPVADDNTTNAGMQTLPRKVEFLPEVAPRDSAYYMYHLYRDNIDTVKYPTDRHYIIAYCQYLAGFGVDCSKPIGLAPNGKAYRFSTLDWTERTLVATNRRLQDELATLKKENARGAATAKRNEETLGGLQERIDGEGGLADNITGLQNAINDDEAGILARLNALETSNVGRDERISGLESGAAAAAIERSNNRTSINTLSEDVEDRTSYGLWVVGGVLVFLIGLGVAIWSTNRSRKAELATLQGHVDTSLEETANDIKDVERRMLNVALGVAERVDSIDPRVTPLCEVVEGGGVKITLSNAVPMAILARGEQALPLTDLYEAEELTLMQCAAPEGRKGIFIEVPGHETPIAIDDVRKLRKVLSYEHVVAAIKKEAAILDEEAVAA